MNKDTAKDYLPLVQALAEGKTIQYKDSNGKWSDVYSPCFNIDPRFYRIKPEPKKAFYRVGLLKNGSRNFYTYSVDTESSYSDFEKKGHFVRWLTDRIEYTLPEGDA